MKKPIYIIAGEKSGDNLGSAIMKAFPAQYVGVGGSSMAEIQSFRLKYASTELSVMGLVEIIPHMPRLYKLIRKTVEDIFSEQPTALITIDAPDFNKRVVQRLKRDKRFKKNPFPCIHVGAPTVWAWRPKRAHKYAKIWDELWTLFPFEPPYFPNMKAMFVGHPLGDNYSFNKVKNYKEEKICLLLPGSRPAEIRQHWPILKAMCEQKNNITYVVKTLPHLVELIEAHGPLPSNCRMVFDFDMADAYVAVAASGTVSLELARAGTPMITFYKMSPITAWIARRLIKTPYVNLVNILLKDGVVPELLQNDATTDAIIQQLDALWNNKGAWEKQRAKLDQAIKLLQSPKGSFFNSVREILENKFNKI